MDNFKTCLSILLSTIAVGAFSGTASADSATDTGSAESPQLLAVNTSVGVKVDPGLRMASTSDRSPAIDPGLQELISTTPIRFVSRSGELGAIGRRNLRSLVVPLLVNSGMSRIVIEGHTDLRGKEDVNDRIGLARAEEVSQYLTSIGVPAEMLVVRSVGERRPLVPDSSAAANRVNRRVEIRLIK